MSPASRFFLAHDKTVFGSINWMTRHHSGCLKEMFHCDVHAKSFKAKSLRPFMPSAVLRLSKSWHWRTAILSSTGNRAHEASFDAVTTFLPIIKIQFL